MSNGLRTDALIEVRFSPGQFDDVHVAYFSGGQGYRDHARVEELLVFDLKRLA